MKHPISFHLNDKIVSLEVSAQETLLDALRLHLGLTGTKEACNEGNCGACTVLLDSAPVYACMVLAVEVDGSTVETVEGMEGEELHPLQKALIDQHGLQCGYCSPGILLTAQALLSHNSRPNKTQIREALAGNLCRCTGYTDIIKAVQVASRARR